MPRRVLIAIRAVSEKFKSQQLTAAEFLVRETSIFSTDSFLLSGKTDHPLHSGIQ